VSLLEVRSVSVTFGGVAALKRVSFTLGENEIVGLIGPSVSGHSLHPRLMLSVKYAVRTNASRSS
jgi:ABC-type branched-subunit amino acid transport system ATPase component